MTERRIGRVEHWTARGFGFVYARGIGYFVHVSEIGPASSLARAQLVEFTPVRDARGPRATQVRILRPDCPKCGEPIGVLRCRRCGFRLEAPPEAPAWLGPGRPADDPRSEKE